METYTFEIHDLKATAKYERDRFVVLKGSQAVGDGGLGNSFLKRKENEGRRKMRKQLLQEGKLVPDGNNLIFNENVEFNSPSQAATIIAGSNQDGPKVFGLHKNTMLLVKPEINYKFYEIDSESALEGYKKDRQILASQRNRSLSDLRKKSDNYTCQACDFQLQVKGKFIIECHHKNPLSISGKVETSLDDLVSLCPTCHRIAHIRKPPYSVGEIKDLIKGKNYE